MAYQFECVAPDCVLLVRSKTEDEIVEIAERHAREYHDKTADPERVRARIEAVEVPGRTQ